jgi:hypothetical protein
VDRICCTHCFTDHTSILCGLFILLLLCGVLQATVLDYSGTRSDAGQFHGHGRAVFSSGHLYEGEWQQGHMHGSGRLTFPDGVCYEGSFAANSVTGKGVSSAGSLEQQQ